MFVKTYAASIVGIDAVRVTVEVNIAGGGLGLYLVGLPDNAVKESQQRINSALRLTVWRRGRTMRCWECAAGSALCACGFIPGGRTRSAFILPHLAVRWSVTAFTVRYRSALTDPRCTVHI